MARKKRFNQSTADRHQRKLSFCDRVTCYAASWIPGWIFGKSEQAEKSIEPNEEKPEALAPAKGRLQQAKEIVADFTQTTKDTANIVSPYFRRENAYELANVVASNFLLPFVSSYAAYWLSTAGGTNPENRGTSDRLMAGILTAVIASTVISRRFTVNQAFKDNLRSFLFEQMAKDSLAQQTLALAPHSDHQAGKPNLGTTINSNLDATLNTGMQLYLHGGATLADITARTLAYRHMVGPNATLATLGIAFCLVIANTAVNRYAYKEFKNESEQQQFASQRLSMAHSHDRQIGALGAALTELHATSAHTASLMESKNKHANKRAFSNLFAWSAFSNFDQIVIGAVRPLLLEGTTAEQLATFGAGLWHITSQLNQLSSSLHSFEQLKTSVQELARTQRVIEDAREFNRNKPLTIITEEHEVKEAKAAKRIKIGSLTISIPSNQPAKEPVSLIDKANASTSKESKDKHTLHNASLELEAGRIYRLAGISGSGKSLLLKTIHNSYPFAKGKIELPFAETDIFFMPQELFIPPGKNPNKASLLEIIAYANSQSLDSNVSIAKIEMLMDQLGLSRLKPDIKTEKSWQSLSPGEQQRINLLRVLMRNPKPKLLLMDEITSAVDAKGRDTMLKLVKEHMPPDTTIICIDHTPPGIMLDNGNILTDQPALIDRFNAQIDAFNQEAESKGEKVILGRIPHSTSFHDATITIGEDMQLHVEYHKMQERSQVADMEVARKPLAAELPQVKSESSRLKRNKHPRVATSTDRIALPGH